MLVPQPPGQQIFLAQRPPVQWINEFYLCCDKTSHGEENSLRRDRPLRIFLRCGTSARMASLDIFWCQKFCREFLSPQNKFCCHTSINLLMSDVWVIKFFVVVLSSRSFKYEVILKRGRWWIPIPPSFMLSDDPHKSPNRFFPLHFNQCMIHIEYSFTPSKNAAGQNWWRLKVFLAGDLKNFRERIAMQKLIIFKMKHFFLGNHSWRCK